MSRAHQIVRVGGRAGGLELAAGSIDLAAQTSGALGREIEIEIV